MEDIRHITTEQLTDFLLQHGEKKFRAAQIQEWLWKRGALTFAEMTNLSVALRQLLEQHFTFQRTAIE